MFEVSQQSRGKNVIVCETIQKKTVCYCISVAKIWLKSIAIPHAIFTNESIAILLQ